MTPDAFEELCFRVLGEMGFTNRDWMRGPGDSGRDITAERVQEDFPGRPRVTSWIIECKRKTSGGLSVSDLQRSVAWLDVHKPENYLIVTSAWLTVQTKAWLEGLRQTKGYNIHWFEGAELEQFVERNLPGDFVRLTTASGSDEDLVLLRLSEAMEAERDATDEQFLMGCQAWDELNAGVDPRPLLVSLREVHTTVYDGAGWCRTTCKLRIGNASRESQTTDTFRLYGDRSLVGEAAFRFSSHGLDATEPYSVPFDAGIERLLELRLVKPLGPGEIADYAFSYSWPVPSPLAGVRYYSSFGRRPKRQLRIEFEVPDSHAWIGPLALRVARGTSKRAEQPAEISDDGLRFVADCSPLRFREQFLVMCVAVDRDVNATA